MTEEVYYERRRELIREQHFLRSRHCNLAARARIRKIAELDSSFKGTPYDETLQRFNYDQLLKKQKSLFTPTNS